MNTPLAKAMDEKKQRRGARCPPGPTAAFGAAAHRLRRAGMVASAVIGAICGGVFAYRDVHHATKSQLARLGKAVPANSSALLTFADAPDPPGGDRRSGPRGCPGSERGGRCGGPQRA